jgi:hypothetical protein
VQFLEINRSAHGPFIYQTLSHHTPPHFPSLFSTMNQYTGTRMVVQARTLTRSGANRRRTVRFVQYMTTDVDNAPSFIRVVRESGGAAMRISCIDHERDGYSRGAGADVTMSTDDPWEDAARLWGHVFREFPALEMHIDFVDYEEGCAGVYTREQCENTPFMAGMSPNPYWRESIVGRRLDLHFDIMRSMRLLLTAHRPPSSSDGLVVGQTYTMEEIRSLLPDATFIHGDSPPDSPSREPSPPLDLSRLRLA